MSAIDLLISPRPKDLGGFTVQRALPHARRRTVGPFIFWDEMGPGILPPGKGVDVRPHPHIGLATVTYLFDGEMTHKDNLGYDEVIRPGDVNLMVAGNGVVHSERSSPEARAAELRIHGIQSWIALPQAEEDRDASFARTPAADIPKVETDGARLAVIMGEAYGAASPVETFQPMFYVAADMEAGARLEAPDYEERAVYLVSGAAEIDGEAVAEGDLAVLKPGVAPILQANETSKVMLLGGAPMDGPRHIFWNYVSSSEEKIEQAKADWAASAGETWTDGRFTLPEGETEYIPLPE